MSTALWQFVFACFFALFSAVVFCAADNGGLASEVWAAWVQAIGTIAAIAGGFVLIHYERRLDRRAARERRGAFQTRAIMLADTIATQIGNWARDMTRANLVLNSMGAVLDLRQGRTLELLDDQLQRFPVDELDHPGFASILLSVRAILSRASREIDTGIDAINNRRQALTPADTLHRLAYDAHQTTLHLRQISGLDLPPPAPPPTA